MSTIALQVGQRIRNYRIQAGLSQEKLAELASYHPTYIGQLERGEKNATLESIERVASALNVPLSKLFEKLESAENEGRKKGLLPSERILRYVQKKKGMLFCSPVSYHLFWAN